MHFPDQIPKLKNRRVHEVCGPAAVPYALMMASRAAGTIMFIDAAHSAERLHPAGAGCFVDISRLLVARGKSQADILWIAEEALRSRCVPVVIARLPESVDLTAGRRLQLAAEAGRSLGLFLIRDGEGSNTAETRWHCTQVNTAPDRPLDSTLFQWTCIKNKTGTTGTWTVHWNAETHHINCLAPTGGGSLSQTAAG